MHGRDRGFDACSGGMGLGLKQALLVVGVVFAIALAVVVGKKMSAEAMAVVVGVVCGVAAAIPTSILLLVVSTRRDRQQDDVGSRSPQQASPPVVVIQGGAPQALPPGPQAGYWPTPHPGPAVNREFHVVGGDDLMIEDGRY